MSPAQKSNPSPIEDFNQALDLAYGTMLQVARRAWESRFAGQDPSDACVSVRIHAVDQKTRGVATSGFLNAPAKQPIGPGRLHLPQVVR